MRQHPDTSPAAFDVAVVGCGPVGAVAALALGRAGHSVLVVERQADPYPLPRAVHLDHEMMRIFQQLGVVDALRPQMRATHGHVHVGADGGVIRYLGAHGKPSRFGWSNDYFFYQPELEATLRDALAAYPNVTLRRGCEMTGLRQDDAGVDIALLQDGTAATVRARYAIGCDGARSATRRAVGVALDDLDFEEPWLVVDADVDGEVVFPTIAGLPPEADLQNLSVMMCDPRRPATIVPGRGNHRRWEFMLLPGEDDQAMMAPERVRELVAPWLAGQPHEIVRAATYRFHGLVAERWQVGRVLLAGDAAHQTPPFFGQGMCHGLRDVFNIAWKLDLVLSGRADPALLDTYQQERDPHVRAVIGAAIEAGRYICLLDPEQAAARDARLRAAARPNVSSTAADLIPPVREGVVEPESGERFIQPTMTRPDGSAGLLDDLSGGGFRLLCADPSLCAGLDEEARAVLDAYDIRVLQIGARNANDVDLIDSSGDVASWLLAHGAGAVLLRPDFYVYGSAATRETLAALLRRLGRRLACRAA